MSNKVSLGNEQTVGSRVGKMRVRLGLTQQELAYVVGVSEKDIKLFERDMPVTLDCERRVLVAYPHILSVSDLPPTN